MYVGIDLYIHSLIAQISDLIPNFEIRSLFHTLEIIVVENLIIPRERYLKTIN